MSVGQIGLASQCAIGLACPNGTVCSRFSDSLGKQVWVSIYRFDSTSNMPKDSV